jgi:hypothetical protein
VSVWGAIAGGFAGTLVLTTALRAASELNLTRMDLPFLLGTAFSTDRTRAKALGYIFHFLAGLVFALIYYAIFLAIDHSGWWLGAIFGLAHGLFSGTALVNILLPLPRRVRDGRRRLHLPGRLSDSPRMRCSGRRADALQRIGGLRAHQL